MNKKLLAVLIGSALAASMSAVQADTTLYGQIDASIDSIDVDGGSDDINMNSNYSSLGVRGSEDLGNGLKAIYQAEFSYDTTEGDNFGTSGGTEGRDQWLGVAGDFGSVRAGTTFTTYHDHGAMIDPLYRTSLEGRTHTMQDIGVSSGGLQSGDLNGDSPSNDASGLMTNTVRYDSADYNGLGFGAFYSFDDGSDENDSYGIGGQYKNGNILGFADWQTDDAGGDDDAWKLGGSYTMGNIAFYGQYEKGGLLFSTTDSANIWHLGGSFTMGNTMLYAAYGQSDEDTGAAGQDTSWTLAVLHSLSQRTKLYAGFNQVDNDVSGETDHFGLGMRTSF